MVLFLPTYRMKIPLYVFLACVIAKIVDGDLGAKQDDLNILVMGDWGGVPYKPWASPFEVRTSESMSKTADRENTQAVFALGDNFYYNGVTDEFDKRFQRTFENVFHQESLKNIPWYILAGNHDHYGNISAQIAYSSHSKRWKFPSLWYTVSYRLPKFSVMVLMIDTVTLCGNTLLNEEGGQPMGAENLQEMEEQLDYIRLKLSTSNADYIMVMGHYPVYSIAEHGSTDCLIEKLKPLLEKYNVSAYLSGHDHNLQHLKENGINYFVSGAVDMIDLSTEHKKSVPDGALLFHWANKLGLGGFATVEINEFAMSLKFHKSSDGGVKVIYKSSPISPRT